jgi:hypothetical protein
MNNASNNPKASTRGRRCRCCHRRRRTRRRPSQPAAVPRSHAAIQQLLNRAPTRKKAEEARTQRRKRPAPTSPEPDADADRPPPAPRRRTGEPDSSSSSRSSVQQIRHPDDDDDQQGGRISQGREVRVRTTGHGRCSTAAREIPQPQPHPYQPRAGSSG